MRLDDLLALSNRLFERQQPFRTLCQTLAEHFYPERADFTVNRAIGDELGDHLIDSYPSMMRRDLGDAFSAMLRDGNDWAEIFVQDDPGYAGKTWLDWASKHLMGLMQNHRSGFMRATKQGDHDYAAFGQCVLSVEPNRNYNGLLYRNWHMRDCAWDDDESGMVGHVHRKWSPTLFELKRTFGEDALYKSHKDKLSKDPMASAKVKHIVMPSEMYGKGQFERFENVSIFVDTEHNHVLQEVGINYDYYTVPRFQTIAGSPYAFSPASISALPNARALQSMTFTLMEAAERYARPPLVATAQAVRTDIDLGPDGITWIDKDYDQRTGNALQVLSQDKSGYPIGMDMRQGVVNIIAACFYHDRLTLPDTPREMTAYEVRERMKQYRRRNLPLFAPMEHEYNGQLCEASLKLAMSMNLMGSPYDIPPSLKGQETEWRFKTPLSDADEERKVQQFRETAELLSMAVQMDETIVNDLNPSQAFRDAVEATGSPMRWLRDLEEAGARKEMQGKMAAIAAMQQAQGQAA